MNVSLLIYLMKDLYLMNQIIKKNPKDFFFLNS